VGWSWVDPFNVENYEQVVLRNGQAIRDRLPCLGIDYLWISIGNLKDRRPGDWLSWNTTAFPSGRECSLKVERPRLPPETLVWRLLAQQPIKG
jgi:hypothetical protein